MYHFIYWFFYKYFIWRKSFRSSIVASSTVGLAIAIHILLVLSIIKVFTGWTIKSFLTNYEYGARKWIMILMILPLFFGLDFFYFRKRKDEILNKYVAQNPFTTKHIALIFLIMLVPLILTFVLN